MKHELQAWLNKNRPNHHLLNHSCRKPRDSTPILFLSLFLFLIQYKAFLSQSSHINHTDIYTQLMSNSNLAKKLQPAAKAWKSFANKLKSKLQKLKISKLLKKTTHHLKYSLRSIRVLVLRKARPPTSYHSLGGHRSSSRRRHCNHHQLPQMNFAAIYVDELFAGPASLQMDSTSSAAGESKAKTISTADERGSPVESSSAGSSSFSIADAWKAAVSSSPRLQGIDERAEEFISKFREDMRLQREKSLLDFYDMLARGA